MRKRTGQDMRTPTAKPELPPGVVLDDDVTPGEAVATALWNSPSFEAELADLGIARADVVQAGLLPNPVFSLLFPWGPKQLEATLKWPLDAMWERPRRQAAAESAANAVAERLVANGLSLVAETQIALIDLATASERARLADDDHQVARRIADLAGSRLEAGDISELEAGVAEVDADRARQDAAAASLQIALAQHRLHQLMGVGEIVSASKLRAALEPQPEAGCRSLATVERDALASRPDVRAAELEIEAAGRRLGWERSRVVSLIGILDANAEGSEGFEMGPGLEAGLGVFDRNQAGKARARAELARASARYREVRQRVMREVDDAYAQVLVSRDALRAWRDDIGKRLERQAAQTERAYEAGELSYLALLDARRRLNAGRLRELAAWGDLRRATVRLEQGVGKRCPPEGTS
jgi:cobalt-zinc-cadmium efflux system outer membrane protein